MAEHLLLHQLEFLTRSLRIAEASTHPLIAATLILPGESDPLNDPELIRERLEHQVGAVIDAGACSLEPTTVIDMSSDVDVTKAAMTGLSVDGIDISSSQRVKVTYSSCTAFKTGTAHPDCVQGWSRPGKITSDVLIDRNTMDSQNTQGIFFGNHVRNGVDDGGFDRVTITNNTIRGSYPNGIAVAACRGCVVTDNKAVTMLGSKYKVGINLYGKGITAARNVLVKE